MRRLVRAGVVERGSSEPIAVSSNGDTDRPHVRGQRTVDALRPSARGEAYRGSDRRLGGAALAGARVATATTLPCAPEIMRRTENEPLGPRVRRDFEATSAPFRRRVTFHGTPLRFWSTSNSTSMPAVLVLELELDGRALACRRRRRGRRRRPWRKPAERRSRAAPLTASVAATGDEAEVEHRSSSHRGRDPASRSPGRVRQCDIGPGEPSGACERR